jgi:hypothetical protein
MPEVTIGVESFSGADFQRAHDAIIHLLQHDLKLSVRTGYIAALLTTLMMRDYLAKKYSEEKVLALDRATLAFFDDHTTEGDDDGDPA